MSVSASVIWVIDTSSIIAVRRLVENSRKASVFQGMGALVESERLVFPKQVLDELERAADPKAPDAQYSWAKQHKNATHISVSLDGVKAVLGAVPEVLDPEKDTGVEEADPYVLALAKHLQSDGKDCRIVTEELRDTPTKMSMSTAGGLLGIPSTPLLAFLKFEGIL